MSSSDELARFAAELRFSDLPDAVVDHARLCVLDTLGCALFGSTLDWSRIVRETLGDLSAVGTDLVWGTNMRLPACDAALANGTATHAFELDDLHPRSIVHPGSVVLCAAVAAGASSGPDLLTALVAGYEVVARVGMSVGSAHLLAGWHPTGTHGTLGAAAAAGSALGLSAKEMADAFGIAGSQSSGLMASQYGSMVKRFHAGRAAQSGLYGALLARRGFTGIADLFEADYGGYGRTFSPSFDPSALTAGLGTTWETLDVGFKVYSTNGSCHPTIDALRALRAEHDLAPDMVRAIDVSVSSATKRHVGWPYVPDSVTTAQMNLSYIAAVVVAEGEAFVDQFDADHLSDPDLVALAEKVRVHADPQIDAAGESARHRTRIEVVLHDGRVLSAQRTHAKGSAGDPIARREVLDKYRRLAVKALSPTRASQLEELVEHLEAVGDLEALLALLEPEEA